jgi:hypothetical protein
LVGKEALWRLDADKPHGQLLDLQRQICDAVLNPSCHVYLHEPGTDSAASQTEGFLHRLVAMQSKERTSAIALLGKLVDQGWAERLEAIQGKIDSQLAILIQSLEAWEHYPTGSESDQQHRKLMRELADFSIPPHELTEANQLSPLVGTAAEDSRRLCVDETLAVQPLGEGIATYASIPGMRFQSRTMEKTAELALHPKP